MFVFLVRNTADKEPMARESPEWKWQGRRQKLCVCTGEVDKETEDGLK